MPEREDKQVAQALAQAECELISRLKRGATEADCVKALQFYGNALLAYSRATEEARKK